MQFRKTSEPSPAASPPANGPPPSPAPSSPPDPAVPGLEALERAVLGETGVRNRDLFLRHLFAGAVDDYERVLRRLQAAPDWSTASKIIAEDVFRRQQVNIYSDPAVAFTDAVEAKFS